LRRSAFRCAHGLALALAAGGAASCRAVGPEYEPPPIALPAHYQGASAEDASASPSEAALSASLAQWWHGLDQAQLPLLIERALAANLELEATRARLRESRALLRVAGAALGPELSAHARYERQRRSEIGSIPISSQREDDFFELGFDASWELDLFGGLERAREAALAEHEARAADAFAARLSVCAEVARQYVELCGAGERLALLRESIASQAEALELLAARTDAGLSGELDLVRAQAQLQDTRARAPELEAALALRTHALAVLLGQPPAAAPDWARSPAPIPAPRALPEAGLPSELLARRPDLLRAERELAAQSARIGVAQAELYPRVALNAGLGARESELGELGTGGARYWSIGPTLALPLFNGGALRAGVEAARARAEQAALAYRQLALVALREVEDAFAARAAQKQRADWLAQSAASAQRSLALASELYERGLEDYLAVLDARRASIDARDALAQSRVQFALEHIALCKALGGGWDALATHELAQALAASESEERAR
jgi:multidrug efflux system outer membrane protein